MRISRQVASFDSASAMVRATARFLHGRDFPALGMPAMRLVEPLMVAANLLPASARELLYARSSGREGLDPDRLGSIRAEQLAAAVVAVYPRRRYPAAAIGSSSGALVHLCAALGIPFLPQTLLVPVSQPHVDPDEPRRGMEAARAPARALLDANPDLVLHQMHDANQDRLTLRRLSYFRVKRTTLGHAYEQFLTDTLAPGATLLLVECRRTWPTTEVSDRHIFQHGAVGGAEPQEYVHGSARVATYLRRYGAHRLHWDAPEPDADRPEAEWGFEPALRDDVARFADRHGYRVRRILYDDPQDLSPLVADLYRWWYAQRGIPAHRLLVESFILLEPWWALRTASVPYWTTFAVRPAAEALCRYLDAAAPYEFIDLVLFSHGVDSIGLVPISDWHSLLDRARTAGRFAGVDADRYPRDLAVFARYQRAIRQIPARYPLPPPLGLTGLDAFLSGSADRYAVTVG